MQSSLDLVNFFCILHDKIITWVCDRFRVIEIFNHKIITLWCLINVPPLINFRKFFSSPAPYLDPPLINLGKFLFQQLQNI